MLDAGQRQELPNNLEAEQAVLGSILARNETLFDLTGILGGADFFEPWHGSLFNYMRDQIESSRSITTSTVIYDFAQDKKIAKGLTASSYVRILVDSGLPAGAVVDVARIVRDLSVKRQILSIADRVSIAIRKADATTSAEAIRLQLETEIEGLFTGVEELGIRSLAEVTKAVLSRVENAYKDEK